MALAVACLLWLAASAAAGLGAPALSAQGTSTSSMQLHEPPAPGLADNLSLPPASQWRLSFEQGRRLEGARDPDLYQMLLAWFQHEILGLLCGLLFFLPLIYLRQWPNCLGHLHQRQLLCHHLQFRFCHGD
ncbi:hypothetical protein [Aeromonas rivipollensis]|uniref:hypothetical protein n=1 Tax=Aeromonas rivipollensis TaxID=948519 RepID=UPI00297811D3|nr:hypothetical protein [Aeromonas rivipollensis]